MSGTDNSVGNAYLEWVLTEGIVKERQSVRRTAKVKFSMMSLSAFLRYGRY